LGGLRASLLSVAKRGLAGLARRHEALGGHQKAESLAGDDRHQQPGRERSALRGPG
jgi:hypothetical protein